MKSSRKPVSKAITDKVAEMQLPLKSVQPHLDIATQSAQVTSPKPAAVNETLLPTTSQSTSISSGTLCSDSSDNFKSPVKEISDLSLRDKTYTDRSLLTEGSCLTQRQSVKDCTDLSGGSLMRTLALGQDPVGRAKSVSLNDFQLYPAGKPVVCTSRRKKPKSCGAGEDLKHSSGLNTSGPLTDFSPLHMEREPPW